MIVTWMCLSLVFYTLDVYLNDLFGFKTVSIYFISLVPKVDESCV